jgi:hypothetical protein
MEISSLVCIIIIIVIALYYFIINKKEENFYTRSPLLNFTPYYTGCKTCKGLDKESCGFCLNCGWCINKNGQGKCTPGDSNGPHFKNDCYIWRHPDRFHRFKPRFAGRKFTKFGYFEPNI